MNRWARRDRSGPGGERRPRPDGSPGQGRRGEVEGGDAQRHARRVAAAAHQMGRGGVRAHLRRLVQEIEQEARAQSDFRVAERGVARGGLAGGPTPQRRSARGCFGDGQPQDHALEEANALRGVASIRPAGVMRVGRERSRTAARASGIACNDPPSARGTTPQPQCRHSAPRPPCQPYGTKRLWLADAHLFQATGILERLLEQTARRLLRQHPLRYQRRAATRGRKREYVRGMAKGCFCGKGRGCGGESSGAGVGDAAEPSAARGVACREERAPRIRWRPWLVQLAAGHR